VTDRRAACRRGRWGLGSAGVDHTEQVALEERVMAAMLEMKKIDIQALKQAYEEE
jgi:predicted 3-demethylubiquinone-9 3-methyltransferase (glyoxalase superfamily)